MTLGALDPSELAATSPLVAAVLARLFAAHPALARMPAVGLAMLATTARYERQLRGAPDLGPIALDEAAVRRELMFFENTKRPLAVDPTLTAVDLVSGARGEIPAGSARRAFDRAVAAVVHAARITRTNVGYRNAAER